MERLRPHGRLARIRRQAAPPPKPTAMCVVADAPPQLDGLLNEPFWQLALPLPLKPGKTAPRTDGVNSPEVQTANLNSPTRTKRRSNASRREPNPTRLRPRLSLRRRHLQKPAGAPYATSGGPRRTTPTWNRTTTSRFVSTSTATTPRTTNCSSTAAARPPTAAGATPPGIPSGSSQPANSTAPAALGAEIAIPWSELTPTPPKSGQAWACSLARTLPPTAAAPAQSSDRPRQRSPRPRKLRRAAVRVAASRTEPLHLTGRERQIGRGFSRIWRMIAD